MGTKRAGAGAGPKRAAPKNSAASTPSKKLRLDDTSAGAGAGPSGGAEPKRAAPKTPAAPVTNQKTMRAATTTPAASVPNKKMKM
jgi:hypothetical protein